MLARWFLQSSYTWLPSFNTVAKIRNDRSDEISQSVLCDGDDLLFVPSYGRQGSFHRQDAVFGERGLDELGVGALGKQELSVVLAVDGAVVRLLLVLGVDLEGEGAFFWWGDNKYQWRKDWSEKYLHHLFLIKNLWPYHEKNGVLLIDINNNKER